jgi:hypothetical protein
MADMKKHSEADAEPLKTKPNIKTRSTDQI